MADRSADLEAVADAAREFVLGTVVAATRYTDDELDLLERLIVALRRVHPGLDV